MPKFPRVHAFINALSEATRVIPVSEGIPGLPAGYAGGADGRGYTIMGHWSEDQLEYAIGATVSRDCRTNLEDAVEIVAEIDQLRAVTRELKAAFARSELDGGAKAALQHPLYLEAEARLAELHEELMGLI